MRLGSGSAHVSSSKGDHCDMEEGGSEATTRGIPAGARGVSAQNRGLTQQPSSDASTGKGGGTAKQAQAAPPGVRPIVAAARERIQAAGSVANLPWAQLNPNTGAVNNCPAAAAAVDTLLGTGDIVPAQGGDHLTTYSWPSVAWSNTMTQAQLMAFVQSSQFPRNRFITVMGIRTPQVMAAQRLTRTHFFVLANVHVSGVPSGIYAIDAWGSGQAAGPGAAPVLVALTGLRCSTFQYSRSRFRVTASEGSAAELDSPFPPGM